MLALFEKMIDVAEGLSQIRGFWRMPITYKRRHGGYADLVQSGWLVRDR